MDAATPVSDCGISMHSLFVFVLNSRMDEHHLGQLACGVELLVVASMMSQVRSYCRPWWSNGASCTEVPRQRFDGVDEDLGDDRGLW